MTLRPLFLGTTYTRLLHLWVPMLFVSVWLFIDMSRPWVPAVLLIPLGLVPAVRRGEGVQARYMLAPDAPRERGDRGAAISVAPSATWRDRLRTVLWLEARMGLGAVTTGVTVWMPVTAIELAGAACARPVDITLLPVSPPPWACALLVPVPLLALYGAVVGLGELVTAIAHAAAGPLPRRAPRRLGGTHRTAPGTHAHRP